MPTSKQKRQAAQRHLQRQLERRAELAQKRRQRNIVLAAALSVLVVVGGVFLFTTLGNDSPSDAAASATTAPATDTASAAPTTAPATTAADGTIACTYIPDDPAASPNIKDVGVPPATAQTTAQVTLAVTTTQGDMTFVLDQAGAPCAVNSFVYLASQKFFDNSPCHRLVNADTFGVLQCGDPSGTGMGGPAYAFDTETPASATPYTTGVIAMANSGQPGTTGSQFFIMFQDTDLPPDYSVVGTVTTGLDVVQKVAAAGNDGSFEASAGGGAPNLPITITSIMPVA